MNANLEYLADSLIIEALAKDESLIVLAQENIVSSVASGVKDYVADIYDSKRPLASIMAFMGPGLLWRLNFSWLSVLYAVADALGFDWKSFWSTVGRGIVEFVRTIISSRAPASQEEAGSHITEVVSNAFENNFTGEVDKEKLLDIARKRSLANDISEAKELKALAIRLEKNPGLIKKAQVLRLFRGKLSRFFIRMISWLVKTALVSLGFVSAEGAVAGLTGTTRESTEGEEAGGPIESLQISPNVSQDMFEVHPNDMSRVWIERGDINTIDMLLKQWILGMYPQLSEQIDDIASSSAYQSILSAFRERNRLATGLGMLSIPRPYQRKADVVAAILNSYLKQHPQNVQKSQQQPGNNTVYK